MEQINYNPEFNQERFAPKRAPNLSVGIEENAAAARSANAQNIAQMRSNREIIAQQYRQEQGDLRQLSKFSQSLFDTLEKEVYRKADDDYAEGMLQASINPELYDGSAEEQQLKAEGAVINDGLAKVEPGNEDVTLPVVRGSRFFQAGVRDGRAQQLLTTSYGAYLDEKIAEANPQTSEELAQVQAAASKQFFIDNRISLDNLSDGFAKKKFFPMLNQLNQASLRKGREAIAQEQSFNTQTEAFAKFNGDKDISSLLGTLSLTVDGNGNRLGYRGAWKTLQTQLTRGIQAGTISEADVEAMRQQPIPGDPKGRTYGELHGVKFDQASKDAADARRRAWSDEQTDKTIAFKTEEQALLDAFLGADADGYTDEQIEDAVEKLEAAHAGMDASRLRKLMSTTVDAKTREKQDEQIQDLIALGLLTPERLSKFDRKLQAKYMGTAQQQARMSAAAGDYKTHLKVVEDAVKVGPEGGPSIAATADGRMNPSVRMVSAQMQQYFLKKVQEYAVSNPDQAADLALKDTLDYFNTTYKDKVTVKGYSGVFGTSQEVQNARIMADARIGDIDDAMKDPNFLEPGSRPNLYTRPELEAMEKGYGKPGWRPDASITYIAQRQGIDELTVLNRLRAQQGLPELASTPASEVVANELTPAQRAALSNIGTTEVSTRTMSTLSNNGFRADLVPNGYAPMVQKSAAAAGIGPALVAAMAEIESGWNPGIPSYNGSSFGLMQIHRSSHPEFFKNNNWQDPQASLDYGAKFFAGLIQRYNGDVKAAAMAYNAGPGAYDEYAAGRRYNDAKEREMINHGVKFMKALDRYQAVAVQPRANMRTSYTSNVPYINQRAAVNGYGDRQCFSASATMVANSLGVKISYDDYNNIRSRYGDTTTSAAQIGALKELGINASVDDTGTLEELTSLANNKQPVAIGIKQSDAGSGHWIVVLGTTPNGDFIVNDPFGQLVQRRNGGWAYTNSRNGGEAGKGVVYSADFLRQVWVDRGPGTGRIMRVQT